MRFAGTQQDCDDVVAELDADLGYPRTYTEADVTSGLVVRHGSGPWAPIESIATATVAQSEPASVDANGDPVGVSRVLDLPRLAPDNARRVARKRVVRILNRGSRAKLIALPGVGPARADAIIALRANGRFQTIGDVNAALPPAAMQALRDYADTLIADADEDEA